MDGFLPCGDAGQRRTVHHQHLSSTAGVIPKARACEMIIVWIRTDRESARIQQRSAAPAKTTAKANCAAAEIPVDEQIC